MKTIVLGDIHGRKQWFNIIVEELADKVIFLGDYVSTHEGISAKDQLDNLDHILKYKEANLNKVVLLRGNHDLCELGYYWAECDPSEPDVREVMSNDPLKSRFENLTQWVYIDDESKIVFSHAGISQVWMYNNNIDDIHGINSLEPSEIFGFTPNGFTPNGFFDTNGTSITQPPTWIRPQTLCMCNIKGWTQVIGHTPVHKITDIYKATKYNEHIWCCDALRANQYLVIDNNVFTVKTINYESTNL